MAESVEDEPHEHVRRILLGIFGVLLDVGAIWLVAAGKNEVFAGVLALAGVVCVLLALIPERFEELEAGSLKAKLRRKRAEAIDELSIEKATSAEVTVSEPRLTTASSFLATIRALDALLHPVEGPLAGCQLHLYTFSDEAGLLVPVYEADPSRAPSSWAPGVGVTGQAYITDSFVLATGEHTHNASFGLTEEEQTKHLDLHEVAALPVSNAAGNTIAILAASNRVKPGLISSTDGYEELLALAEATARILVDLLGGFPDD